MAPRTVAGNKVKPLRNERRPAQPIRWAQPSGSFPYKVKDGDTWITLAKYFAVKNPPSPRFLIFFNFYVDVATPGATNEVNWYLREYVGCNVSRDGGRNWAFSNSADPGIIYIPQKTISFEGEGMLITGSSGVGGTVSVPQYDDGNFLDTLSKALDIYGMVETGLGVSEAALPLLAEAGLIAAGAAAGIVGPAVAVGSGHGDALRKLSRDYFFEGFSFGLVMSANGATDNYLKERHYLKYPPLNSVYPEKRETFRKLHNLGLELGIRQGKKFNSVDKKAFFEYLHGRLSRGDQQRFSPRVPWRDWSESKKKDYYQTLAGMVKRQMLNNGLQMKFK